MPRETFFNLTENKKERVINAAINEFADRGFHKARITAITDRAEIAKGSFYQYFHDKKDLFKYIIDRTVNKKLEYINQDMMANKEKYSFFPLLREIYNSGIKFARENPRLVSIGNIFINNKNLQREIWGEQKDKSLDFYKPLLEEGIKNGELDPDIDTDLISRLLTGLNYSLMDIIYKEGKIDVDNFVEEMDTIDKMISFIKNGIKKRDY